MAQNFIKKPIQQHKKHFIKKQFDTININLYTISINNNIIKFIIYTITIKYYINNILYDVIYLFIDTINYLFHIIYM